eukprot:182477-Karenia_brevis.AAC.1
MGKKTWELRKCPATTGQTVAVVGNSTAGRYPVHGVVDVVDSKFMSMEELLKHEDKHHVAPHRLAKFCKPEKQDNKQRSHKPASKKKSNKLGAHVWVLQRPRSMGHLDMVVNRKTGQVVWVKMDSLHK